MNDKPKICENCHLELCEGCTIPYDEARYGILGEPLTFSQALERLKAGHSVARAAWHTTKGYYKMYCEHTAKNNGKIFRLTPNGKGAKQYSVDVNDILSNDWYQVDT